MRGSERKENTDMTTARLTRVTRLTPAIALAALAFGTTPAYAADAKPILSLSAFAVDLNRPSRAAAGTLYITIERWSTAEERDHLREVLMSRGGDALLSALQKIKPRVGYIRSTKSLGWDLYYAHEVPTEDGGRRIFIATDRPMSFWELRRGMRSVDYEFTLAEVRLDKDGKGVGKLVPAAKIKYNKEKGHIEIEDYQTEPVRLNEVRVMAGGGKKP
jgi:hypothetical protein